MRLLGSSKSIINKDKDGELVPKIEHVEYILVHCNLVKNNYQKNSKLLYSFVPNKTFGELIDISPHIFITLNTIGGDFSYVDVWFTDQDIIL